MDTSNGSTLYKKLDNTREEFRLIRFTGGGRELSWELEAVSLKEANTKWIALSYCWGKVEATKTITLNGQSFLVRPNLYGFLVQMASENRRAWFFVDAICINQKDDGEKAFQVDLMGKIYRRAQEVIAWIYLEESRDDELMDQAKSEDGLRALQAIEKEKAARGQELAADERRLLDDLLNMVKLLVLSSDYWSRLWIVQELLLAEKVTIRWFSVTIEWSDIMTLQAKDAAVPAIQLDARGRPVKPAASSHIRKANLWENNAMGGRGENLLLCKQLWHWQTSAGVDLHAGKKLPFHEALEFFAIQDCTQARDSVFGIKGIAECLVETSYSVSLADLYTKALYNALLSLWSTTTSSTQPGTTSTYSGSIQRLQKSSGLDYYKLQSIGTALMFALSLDPFHEVVFLISHEVCKRFAPEFELLTSMALSSDWLMATSYTNYGVQDMGKRMTKRKWYEFEDMFVKRFDRDVRRRSEEAFARFKASAKDDSELAGPGDEGHKQVLRASAWVKRVHSSCDDMWSRS